jgi:hypothetical protein
MVGVEILHNGSRSRAQGFTVHLEYLGEKVKGSGRRYTNTGHRGADGAGIAATWDEWGIWIDRLFAIDPDAIIGHYQGYGHFVEQTAQWRPRGMEAPWLPKAGVLVDG